MCTTIKTTSTLMDQLDDALAQRETLEAGLAGDIDFFKRKKELGELVDLTAQSNLLVRVTAGNGHLELSQWLVEESGQAVKVVDENSCAFEWAAAGGHLEIVQWLVEKRLVEESRNLAQMDRSLRGFINDRLQSARKTAAIYHRSEIQDYLDRAVTVLHLSGVEKFSTALSTVSKQPFRRSSRL